MVDPVREIAGAEDLEASLATLHPEAFGWARALVRGNREEAEEVLQVAYLRILSGRARFAGRSRFETWVFGVIRLVARERRRREAVRRLARLRWLGSQGSADVSPGPEERAELAGRVRRTRRALARLSARQREVLHLVFYRGMTLEESAEVLGISAGSVRTHYERGKARLRALLGEEVR